MFSNNYLAVLAGLLAAGGVFAADKAQQDGGKGQTPQAPTTRVVMVKECVPETYQCKVVTYKNEWVDENVRVCRMVKVPETRTRTVVHHEWVTEMRQVTKKHWEWACVEETKTVYRKVTTCKPVTTFVTKVEDRGYWTCKEVPTLHSRLKMAVGHLCASKGESHHVSFEGKGGKGETVVSKCEPCIETRMVRCWHPCRVTVQCPVTVMKKVTECVPETVTCMKKKLVCRETVCEKPVKVCKPVCHTETFTVCVCRPEWTTETRQVCRKVPVESVETRTRYVARCVAKEVPIETCDTCEGCLTGKVKDLMGRARGILGHKKACDCE
ncbi:MAG: hypothetical protein FJ261_08835 [Planctomycetes bacterium]|nr:hypothetical protein [Planctomycetota bacterium]